MLRILINFFSLLLFFIVVRTNSFKLKAKENNDVLDGVVLLFRHGDRSPLSSWPNDPNFGNLSLWPDGYGQLNNFGKQRHFRLGQWFRERYDGFLPKRYNSNFIYIQSTDVDRTLMSAESNLAGLFPPETDQLWNSNIPWQPIPVHTVPEGSDAILATTVPCNKFIALRKDLSNNENIKKINNDYAEFFKTIANLGGYDSVDISTFAEIHSTAIIYKESNLTLPEWIHTYWNEISMFAALDFQLDTYTTELARLRTGPFFKYLLDHLESIKNKVLSPDKHIKGPKYQSAELTHTPSQKFLILSAHDSTVGDRLNAMGVYDHVAPEFASTIIWELKTGDKGVYVNMHFKNSTHFVELKLPGCNFNCKFDKYVKILEPITVSLSDWESECAT